jgi:probable poly-beta-1,6-N-acetyl-D-glucosamine export protein
MWGRIGNWVKNKDKYFLAIDAMRIVAILSVIGIHTTTRVLEESVFDVSGFTFTFFFNQILRFAVPLFFMISGFVLEVNYPNHPNYLSYLKKRLSRIFLPYLFWSAVYYFFIYQKHTISFLKAVLTGDASYQLYFIPTLLLFYILFPLVHRAYRYVTNRWVLYGLGILQLLLLAREYYFQPEAVFYPLTIAILNYYVFIIGIVLARHSEILISFVYKRLVVIGLFLTAMALFVFYEGRSLYLLTGNYKYFYWQWRPSILVYTLVVFAVMYVLFNGINKYKGLISSLSRYSFFVFFVHVIILEYLWKLIGQNLFDKTLDMPGQQLWFNPLFFVSVMIVTYGIAYLIHKFPVITKISG